MTRSTPTTPNHLVLRTKPVVQDQPDHINQASRGLDAVTVSSYDMMRELFTFIEG